MPQTKFSVPTTDRGVRRVQNRIDSKFHMVTDPDDRENLTNLFSSAQAWPNVEQRGRKYSIAEFCLDLCLADQID